MPSVNWVCETRKIFQNPYMPYIKKSPFLKKYVGRLCREQKQAKNRLIN